MQKLFLREQVFSSISTTATHPPTPTAHHHHIFGMRKLTVS